MSSQVSPCRVRSDPCRSVSSRIHVKPRPCRAVSSPPRVHSWRAASCQTTAYQRGRAMPAPPCKQWYRTSRQPCPATVLYLEVTCDVPCGPAKIWP